MTLKPWMLRLIGVALFALALTRIDLRQSLALLAAADGRYLLLAALLTGPLLLARGWRLQVVLRAFGIRLGWMDALNIRLVSAAAGDVTPGRAGELITLGYLNQAGYAVGRGFAGLVIDRLFDVAVFGLTALASLSLLRDLLDRGVIVPTLSLSVILLLVVVLILFFLLSIRRLSPVSGGRWSALVVRRSSFVELRTATLAAATALSAAAFLAIVLRAYCLALALHISISLLTMTGVVALSTFVQLLPISVLGIGTRDLSLVYLFGLLGLPRESALSLSLLVLAMLVLQDAAGLVAWWRHPLNDERRTTNDQQQADGRIRRLPSSEGSSFVVRQ